MKKRTTLPQLDPWGSLSLSVLSPVGNPGKLAVPKCPLLTSSSDTIPGSSIISKTKALDPECHPSMTKCSISKLIFHCPMRLLLCSVILALSSTRFPALTSRFGCRPPPLSHIHTTLTTPQMLDIVAGGTSTMALPPHSHFRACSSKPGVILSVQNGPSSSLFP